MAKNYRLEILAAMAIVGFCLLFLYTSSTIGAGTFAGTDTIAAEKIQGAAGPDSPAITPLIPQWKPPSSEIESALFAFQAALGGLVIGGVFGFWLGQKKSSG